MSSRTMSSPGRSPRTTIAVFAVAAAIGAFDVASFFYLGRASEDFIVARRTRAIPLYRPGEVLSWRGRAPGLLHGWTRPDPDGTFTVGPVSALALRLPERPVGDLELTATAVGIVDPDRLPVRDVQVFVNRRPVALWRFDSSAAVRKTARIPAALVANDGIVRVELHLPEHRSLQALGISPDGRRLGLLLLEWRLDPAAQ